MGARQASRALVQQRSGDASPDVRAIVLGVVPVRLFLALAARCGASVSARAAQAAGHARTLDAQIVHDLEPVHLLQQCTQRARVRQTRVHSTARVAGRAGARPPVVLVCSPARAPPKHELRGGQRTCSCSPSWSATNCSQTDSLRTKDRWQWDGLHAHRPGQCPENADARGGQLQHTQKLQVKPDLRATQRPLRTPSCTRHVHAPDASCP
jgi:hypothetical protein